VAKAATPGLAIECRGLVKRFGQVEAVAGLDLQVPIGGVYGLLGPNGAGKTTTIRMLGTLVTLDAGNAEVFGHDIAREGPAVRSRISLTGQYASVDDDLTATENLVLLGRLLGLGRAGAKDRAAELLEAFGLTEASVRKVKTYSGGMRRRLDIAASIVVTPQLLFLDEPTTGLDPRSRHEVWDITRAMVSEGTTVVLSSQYLNEVDALADRVAIIDKGRLIAEGTTAQLKSSIGTDTVRVRLRDPQQRPAAAELLEKILGEVVLERDPATVSARTPDIKTAGQALLTLASSQVEAADFSVGQPSLDEAFLTLTGSPGSTKDSP
jgi:ABC-2 type transport system ATP-binding protein